jgi:hypothetical protein
MRDQSDGAAFLAELPKEFEDGFAGVRIEVTRGFICEIIFDR